MNAPCLSSPFAVVSVIVYMYAKKKELCSSIDSSGSSTALVQNESFRGGKKENKQQTTHPKQLISPGHWYVNTIFPYHAAKVFKFIFTAWHIPAQT